MSAPVYEPVGTIAASAKDHIQSDDDTILIEQEDEYLIAQPKPENGGDA